LLQKTFIIVTSTFHRIPLHPGYTPWDLLISATATPLLTHLHLHAYLIRTSWTAPSLYLTLTSTLSLSIILVQTPPGLDLSCQTSHQVGLSPCPGLISTAGSASPLSRVQPHCRVASLSPPCPGKNPIVGLASLPLPYPVLSPIIGLASLSSPYPDTTCLFVLSCSGHIIAQTVAWYLDFSVVHDLWHLLISACQLLCRPFIKSFIQGFPSSIALKIFLIVLPTILMFMSKFEGLISQSSLARRSASKYYIFLFFNVFWEASSQDLLWSSLKPTPMSANEYVLCNHIY
jgi:hypothetical protein